MSNIQSFGKTKFTDKTSELEEVLVSNFIDVGVFTETWETENTLGKLDFDQYNMFHFVRKNFKRSSGGVSIFIKDHIPATLLNVNVPNDIEALYISIRPPKLPRSISNIIICGLYYPGSKSIYAPPQDTITLHLAETIQSFYSKYACPLILLLGDFNDLNTTDICQSCSFKQVVKVPTRKDAILDLIMTNQDSTWYKDPISLPSIDKSDHLCVLYAPKNI